MECKIDEGLILRPRPAGNSNQLPRFRRNLPNADIRDRWIGQKSYALIQYLDR